MSDVRTLLKKRPLLFDGGMGTYYKGAPGRECERANRLDPEGIRAVHRAYLAAGLTNVELKLYPNGRHELLNDRFRDEVRDDLLDWLNRNYQ